MLAEQIISEEKAVMAPAYIDIPKQQFSFKHVEVEQRTDMATISTASIGWTMYGKPFPRRSVPAWALTAKIIARSRRLVSRGLLAMAH